MKINLCSGPSLFPPPWLNVDRVDQSEYIRILREDVPPEMAATWPEHQRRLVEHLRAGGKIDFRTGDARGALGFEADSVDAIYLGQCVEHLSKIHELPGLLHECWTILKPGGVLQITTPDLDKLLDAYRLGRMHQFAHEQPAFYAKADPADQLSYLLFGATGGSCTVENYEGHFHCYTRGTLATMLTEAGFVGPYTFYDAAGGGLLSGDVVDCGMSHSLGVCAVKQ